MTKILKLINYPKETISRGSVLRCKGYNPYEKIVDFLICESFNIENDSYQLIVSSGYKAGLKYCQLPEESIPEGQIMGLKTDWLKNNWTKWGYFECSIEDVYIFDSLVPLMIP